MFASFNCKNLFNCFAMTKQNFQIKIACRNNQGFRALYALHVFDPRRKGVKVFK